MFAEVLEAGGRLSQFPARAEFFGSGMLASLLDLTVESHPASAQIVEDFLGGARIRHRLEIAPDVPAWPLTLERRRNLLLVARVALNNIGKQAAATEVVIRADGSGGRLLLVVEDNGRGFDPASVRPDALGLASKRRRVGHLGRRFEMQSRSGAGTWITVKLAEAGHAQS